MSRIEKAVPVWVLGLSAVLVLGARAPAQVGDPRVVVAPPGCDANASRVDDALEVKLATRTLIGPAPGDDIWIGPGLRAAAPETGRQPYADLLVGLDHPPNDADVQQITAVGGRVIRAWHRLVFCMNVRLPEAAVAAGGIHAIARFPHVTWVEENRRARLFLHYSTRQTRARQCWTRTTAVDGRSDIRLAICDTGLDGDYGSSSVHSDFKWPDTSSKIAAWYDAYYAINGGTNHTDAVDENGHGSHIGGIIAGTGAGAGIDTGDGWLKRTHSAYFSDTSGEVWDVNSARMPIDTTGLSGNSTISSSTYWSFTDTNSVLASLWDSTFPASSGELNWGYKSWTATQPLDVDYDYLGTDIQDFTYMGSPYPELDNDGACWYVSQNSCRQVAVGDGYDLNAGVAPGCSLVGVKVTDEYGSGDSGAAELIEALDWVSTNCQAEKIVGVNISIGYGTGVSASLDTTINGLVADGVVCVVSAGNDRGTADIGSPGTASYAVTVAATSETDLITSYSSVGGTGSGKPDVAAPGGSLVTDRDITSVDTGDAEYVRNYGTGSDLISSTERFDDDYTGMTGTSMAAAHVTGIVGLVADALGGMSSWNWTLDQALTVKSLICMTATETGPSAEAMPNPVVNRDQNGGKDTCEGYGRVNADAAVSAVLDELVIADDGTATATTTLSSDPTGRKCWAQYCQLKRNCAYTFSMTVPTGCDADLYLYDDSHGSNGEPVVVESGTQSTPGADEQFTRSVLDSEDPALDTYYLVAKLVSGTGEFSISGIGITPAQVSHLRANIRNGRPLLCWEVSEAGMLAGFNVFCATDAAEAWEKCNDQLIGSEGRVVTWVPRRPIAPGRTLYYRLESVSLFGAKTDHGFVKVHLPLER